MSDWNQVEGLGKGFQSGVRLRVGVGSGLGVGGMGMGREAISKLYPVC